MFPQYPYLLTLTILSLNTPLIFLSLFLFLLFEYNLAKQWYLLFHILLLILSKILCQCSIPIQQSRAIRKRFIKNPEKSQVLQTLWCWIQLFWVFDKRLCEAKDTIVESTHEFLVLFQNVTDCCVLLEYLVDSIYELAN